MPVADDLVLRETTDADWPAVWALLEPVMRAGESYCWPRDVTADQARPRWVEPPPARTYVAVLPDGTVVGTAQLHPNQDAAGAHVANAGFVTSATAGVRGVGRRLAEHVVAEATRQGYRAMQFNAVVETNRRAVALWRSLGFEVVGTVPEAFDHPTHGLVGLHVMHRRL
ncbi:MAG: GNAT family N-acetyltransferase [Nocardioides sp.]|nr:GNAT family N-acetyltransferase [Nocardioides sp.]